MSPSSKWTQQMGRHRTPRVCHPPPPPPLIPIIPPPPICPPQTITGYVDAEVPGEDAPEVYYSPYEAPGTPPEAYVQWRHEIEGAPGHVVFIESITDAELLACDVIIRFALAGQYHFTKLDLPFDWCTHNFIVLSHWDTIEPAGPTCTLMMQW